MGLSYYLVNTAVYFPFSKIDEHEDEILKRKPLQTEFHGIFGATLKYLVLIASRAQKQASVSSGKSFGLSIWGPCTVNVDSVILADGFEQKSLLSRHAASGHAASGHAASGHVDLFPPQAMR